jgi:hypothetical protein
MGGSVYRHGLGSAFGPFGESVHSLWRGHGVAYPALSLVVNQVVVAATGNHAYWSIVALRIPALLGVALIAACGPRIARFLTPNDPDAAGRAWWWGVLNPLVAVHFIGGAHNDALMAGVSVLAIYATVVGVQAGDTRRGRLLVWLAGPVLVGVAMALKQQGGSDRLGGRRPPHPGRAACHPAARPAVALRPAHGRRHGDRRRHLRRPQPRHGQGIRLDRLAVVDGIGRDTPLPSRCCRRGAGMPSRHWGPTPPDSGRSSGWRRTSCCWRCSPGVVVRFSDRPVAAVGWGSLAVAILGQSMHPWYFPWSLALLGLVPLTTRQRGWVGGL